MSLHTYIPSSVISSSDHNSDHQGLADGTNDTANNSLQTTRLEAFQNFVASGLLIGTSANLISSVASGVAFVNGKRIAFSAVVKTFTASKDTYVDLKDDGTLAYVEVANGATSGMTLTANSVRIAKVVTSGTAVTNVYQTDIGSGAIKTNTDPIGNPVGLRSPFQSLRWYRFDNGGSFFLNSGTPTLITGHQWIVNCPAGGWLDLLFIGSTRLNAAPAADTWVDLYVDGVLLNEAWRNEWSNGNNINTQVTAGQIYVAAGSHTIEARMRDNNAWTIYNMTSNHKFTVG